MARHDDGDDAGLSPDDVYDRMEPFEPYTAGELASILDAPTAAVRKLLQRLAGEERVREKPPAPPRERALWIREPPKHVCPECGGEFEVRYFHPVFQSVQYCPRCGEPVRRR